MLTKIKNLISASMVSFMLLAPVLSVVPASAAADIDTNVKCGVNLDATKENCDSSLDTNGKTAGQNVNDLVADVINIFSWVVGVVAIIMIIVGGFLYITSGGDSSKVGNAKNTILFAIIGLVIVALAQFIVKFVLQRVTTA